VRITVFMKEAAAAIKRKVNITLISTSGATHLNLFVGILW